MSIVPLCESWFDPGSKVHALKITAIICNKFLRRYNNNLHHFTKLIENPNLTKEDLCYNDDELGDNPIMISAKLRHKDLVSSILRSSKFQNVDNNEFLADLIHTKNASGQTLLAMVALQGTMSPQF